MFLYFTDHRATGILVFPRDDLYVKDLMETIHYMREHRLYQKMVLYVEAYGSGSMINHLPSDVSVSTTAAANPATTTRTGTYTWVTVQHQLDGRF